MSDKLFEDFINQNIISRDKTINYRSLSPDILSITKWNWDYQESLEIQYKSIEFVKENPSKKIYIFCNHPHCFTMGRGLQKSQGAPLQGLQEFDSSKESDLNFPLHKISRGGGITFHYPGQWIFYPIINLNSREISLSGLIHRLLETTKLTLEKELDIQNLATEKVFLGLWHKNSKLASVGVGAKNFITHHGIALNINRDDKMFKELSKIHPCGINHSDYVCLSDIISNNDFSAEDFDLLYQRVLLTTPLLKP